MFLHVSDGELLYYIDRMFVESKMYVFDKLLTSESDN